MLSFSQKLLCQSWRIKKGVKCCGIHNLKKTTLVSCCKFVIYCFGVKRKKQQHGISKNVLFCTSKRHSYEDILTYFNIRNKEILKKKNTHLQPMSIFQADMKSF